jgi:hypothetical protein
MVKALNESGFAPDEICVLTGPQDAAKFDAKSPSSVNLSSEERQTLEQDERLPIG